MKLLANLQIEWPVSRSTRMSWLHAATAHPARAVRIIGRKANLEDFSYG